MKVGESKVLCARTDENMFDSWEVFLCLDRTTTGYVLTVKRHEWLGEISEFVEIDDDGEYGELPEKIQGYEVLGTEDNYVIVNNLVDYDDCEAFEFSNYSEPLKSKIKSWLELNDWAGDQIFHDVNETDTGNRKMLDATDVFNAVVAAAAN